eukprot:Blabericola_migrator_1__4582@NODE_2434_length_2762_cov_80_461967_g480_i2_p1_GENE_NODE_2434_length_2762_cov_80_461967_g480_i2NODE_2434_length_2762_cov_80_461967_g480_i2_p1_ORF_typecomplete_len484_score60_68AAA_23/PF13476_6/0_014Dsh_C/PF12316_8/0_087_NODE_2434_length_2762_cov_80_461967_g480_i212462697
MRGRNVAAEAPTSPSLWCWVSSLSAVLQAATAPICAMIHQECRLKFLQEHNKSLAAEEFLVSQIPFIATPGEPKDYDLHVLEERVKGRERLRYEWIRTNQPHRPEDTYARFEDSFTRALDNKSASLVPLNPILLKQVTEQADPLVGPRDYANRQVPYIVSTYSPQTLRTLALESAKHTIQPSEPAGLAYIAKSFNTTGELAMKRLRELATAFGNDERVKMNLPPCDTPEALLDYFKGRRWRQECCKSVAPPESSADQGLNMNAKPPEGEPARDIRDDRLFEEVVKPPLAERGCTNRSAPATQSAMPAQTTQTPRFETASLGQTARPIPARPRVQSDVDESVKETLSWLPRRRQWPPMEHSNTYLGATPTTFHSPPPSPASTFTELDGKDELINDKKTSKRKLKKEKKRKEKRKQKRMAQQHMTTIKTQERATQSHYPTTTNQQHNLILYLLGITPEDPFTLRHDATVPRIEPPHEFALRARTL